MPAIINHDTILKKVLKSSRTQAIAFARLQAKVAAAKEELINDFDGHPVTQELLAGPFKDGSEVLPYGYGNLFSFLGFETEQNPTEPVRKLLERIHLLKAPRSSRNAWTFIVRIPSQEDIDKASPMNWESGRSWVNAVEKGIGTFSHYMFNLKAGRFNNSRSQTAIQVGPNLRNTSAYFAGRGYILGMLKRFQKKILR